MSGAATPGLQKAGSWLRFLLIRFLEIFFSFFPIAMGIKALMLPPTSVAEIATTTLQVVATLATTGVVIIYLSKWDLEKKVESLRPELHEVNRALRTEAQVLSESIEKVIDSLDDSEDRLLSALGGRIESLDSSLQYYEYLTKRAKECRKAWFDMGGIDPNLVHMPKFPKRSEYYEYRSRLAQLDHIQFLYIGVVRTTDHLELLSSMIERSRTSPASLRHFHPDGDNAPRIEVTIVDKEEAILGYYREAATINEQCYISIRNPALVTLFSNYYHDLWARGRRLKDGTSVLDAELHAIEARLRGATNHAPATI